MIHTAHWSLRNIPRINRWCSTTCVIDLGRRKTIWKIARSAHVLSKFIYHSSKRPKAFTWIKTYAILIIYEYIYTASLTERLLVYCVIFVFVFIKNNSSQLENQREMKNESKLQTCQEETCKITFNLMEDYFTVISYLYRLVASSYDDWFIYACFYLFFFFFWNSQYFEYDWGDKWSISKYGHFNCRKSDNDLDE